MYKCKYFKIQELVSKLVYDKYCDFCWRFFSEEFKKDLDTIREFHGKSLTINDWCFGKSNFSQCGFRSNLDPMVKDKKTLYCSAHCMGKAVDLHSADNIKLFNDVKTLITQGKLLTIKRLERKKKKKNGWVHVDCFETTDGKLEIFKG